MKKEGFSGSYPPGDVVFLLKILDMKPTPLAEKERLIQAGKAHYSEMISDESLPSERYLKMFHHAMEDSGPVMARHLSALSAIIAAGRKGPLTIVSLARAGTPVGVLLKRILERYFERETYHYAISIIRDRGIDENALDYIIDKAAHTDASVVFVDGWTGKGIIARELASAVSRYNHSRQVRLSPRLHVLTDLCGEAGVAPSCDDFLIPSSILNSIVSGLISRTILNTAHIAPGDFHGCLYYRHLASGDLSCWFVDHIMDEVERFNALSPVTHLPIRPLSRTDCEQLRLNSRAFVERLLNLSGINYIKPGIGEATRVLLRRIPDTLYLRTPGAADTRHLEILAEEKKVPVIYDPHLPYQAAAIIKRIENA